MSEVFVHESSDVDGAVAGAGTRIWHFRHAMRDSRIGEHGNIGQNVVISQDTHTGSHVFYGPSMG